MPIRLEEFCREIERLGAGPVNVVVLRDVDSTNELAKRIAREYLDEESAPPSAALVGLAQWAGKGRLGRSWHSASGLGVYATLLVSLGRHSNLEILSLLVATGLCDALNRHVGGRCGLKWPNDLMVGGRKLGGVLVETVHRNSGRIDAMVGFGVNHGHGPDGLPAPNATSLRIEADESPPLPALTAELLAAVIERIPHLDDRKAAVRAYRELSIHRPGDVMEVRLPERTLKGSFLGFDDRGFLRLAVGESEERVSAGEVVGG
jgi:BirA family biotin operon repressor/biotin-[acetyl-CoA-carboxylase] ligase